MDSVSESILDYIHARLQDISGAVLLERNSALPESIGADGLMILRDGQPESSQETLGGFDSVYVRHRILIEVFVASGSGAERDKKYDRLVKAIGDLLLQDKTLGGLAYGLTVQRPEPETEALPGMAAIKAATIPVIVEYEAPSPLG
ncbi:MAG: acyl-CoA transferase [Micavibrio sp.]